MIGDAQGFRGYVLPERLDLSTVTDVCADLRLIDGPDIHLDARNLRHLGALGAELLLSAQASAQARGGRLILSSRSEAVDLALTDLGLADIFASEDAS